MMKNPNACVVLVPVHSNVVPACESSLSELERRGYAVWRSRGSSAIDQARSQLATEALTRGFEETIWIDADVGFHPDDIESLRSHDLPMVCGIYPKKGARALACCTLPDTQQLTFGNGGGLREILYAAGGFLRVRRNVYTSIQETLNLSLCNERFGKPLIPFFQPMVVPDGNGRWYLAEDFAFSERARRCGFKIYADTRIRLWHYGEYGYRWEDAGATVTRYGTYDFHVIV